MNYVRQWDGDVPIFDAEGAVIDPGVREVHRGGERYSVRAVLGTSPKLHGEYRPVLYCIGPDGRSAQLAPSEVTLAPPDGGGEGGM